MFFEFKKTKIRQNFAFIFCIWVVLKEIVVYDYLYIHISLLITALMEVIIIFNLISFLTVKFASNYEFFLANWLAQISQNCYSYYYYISYYKIDCMFMWTLNYGSRWIIQIIMLSWREVARSVLCIPTSIHSQCTLTNIHSHVYIHKCTFTSVQCTLTNIHSHVYIHQCTLTSIHWKVYIYKCTS